MPATSARQSRFMGAELARKRAGTRTHTSMSEGQLKDYAKKAKYNSKLMSPKGDIGGYSESELQRAFPRKIKNSGKILSSPRNLPFTREKMAGDSPGISVRKAEKDEVV